MPHRLGALVLLLLLALAALPSPGTPAPDRSAAPRSAQPGRGRFIVAFELRADGPEFVWPLDTFPPARHATVLLVVEEMPRVRARGSSDIRRLSAPRHLQINGRLRHPLRPAALQGRAPGAADDEFVVDLHEGRLRLSVTLPAGSQADARHRTARVALYEVEPVASRRK